jgi:hypothetical protein
MRGLWQHCSLLGHWRTDALLARLTAVAASCRCWPTVRIFYVILYYTVALVAVVSAVRAKSVVMRALPMLVHIFLTNGSVADGYHSMAECCAQ